jgi:hypothetical protein
MGDCGGRARYRGSLHPLGPYRFGFKTDAIPPVSGSFEILPKFVLYPKVLAVIRRKRVMETLVAYTNLSETKTPQVCPILGLDGHVLQVKSPAYASIGSAVKIETDDTMSLGEVSYCQPDQDGYVVWIHLVQALHDVTELSRLARALVA